MFNYQYVYSFKNEDHNIRNTSCKKFDKSSIAANEETRNSKILIKSTTGVNMISTMKEMFKGKWNSI